MKVSVYLTFKAGQCLSAFQFYKGIFGGDFKSQATYAAAPDSTKKTDDPSKDHIMHMSLPLGSNMELMGCDYNSCFHPEGHQFEAGNNVQICVSMFCRDEADMYLEKLAADGGSVEMSMQDTFWGSYFGCCTDKFGIKWMIDCAKNDDGQEVKEKVQGIKREVSDLETIVGTTVLAPENKKSKTMDD